MNGRVILVLLRTIAFGQILAAVPVAAAMEIDGCRDYTQTWHVSGGVGLPFYYGRCLAVNGDAAYASGRHDPLIAVIDLTDPKAPEVVGQIHLPGIPGGLAAGPEALLVTVPGLGLVRYDLSDPLAPSPTDTLDLGPDLREVVLVNDLAFVALGPGGVRAISLEYPGFMLPMGQVATGGGAEALAYADGLLFVADNTAGLVVVEPSDPANLIVAGTSGFGAVARGVAAGHGWAAVTGRPIDNSDWRVTLYDLTDPWAPLALTTRIGDHGNPQPPRPTIPEPGRLLVAAPLEALYEYRFQNGALKVHGEFLVNAARCVWETDRSVLLTYEGILVGTAGGVPPGLFSVIPGGGAHAIRRSSIVYTADHFGLEVSDLTDPLNPVSTVESLPLPGSLVHPALALKDDVLFATDASGAVTLVDVGDPLAPAIVGSVPLSEVPWGLLAEGDLLFAATGLDGLSVLEVGDPLQPVLLGEIPTTPAAYPDVRIAKLGNEVLVARPEGGIEIYDVADPGAPARVGHLPVGTVGDLAVAGDRLLVGLPDDDLQVWRRAADGWIFLGPGPSSRTRALDVHGDVAYVADLWSGLEILDLSAGGIPTILYGRTVLSNTNDSVVAGPDWFAVGSTELLVYASHCPQPTAVVGPRSPRAPLLAPPEPNPFNPRTVLRFSLPRAAEARVDLFDLAGRRVRTLWEGPAPAGETRLTWDGTDGTGRPSAAGVYLARLKTGGRIEIKKLTLVR